MEMNTNYRNRPKHKIPKMRQVTNQLKIPQWKVPGIKLTRTTENLKDLRDNYDKGKFTPASMTQIISHF